VVVVPLSSWTIFQSLQMLSSPSHPQLSLAESEPCFSCVAAGKRNSERYTNQQHAASWQQAAAFLAYGAASLRAPDKNGANSKACAGAERRVSDRRIRMEEMASRGNSLGCAGAQRDASPCWVGDEVVASGTPVTVSRRGKPLVVISPILPQDQADRLDIITAMKSW